MSTKTDIFYTLESLQNSKIILDFETLPPIPSGKCEYGREFKFLFTFLNLHGQCPITFNKNENKYEWKCFSGKTLSTGLVAALTIVLWILYFLDYAIHLEFLNAMHWEQKQSFAKFLETTPNITPAVRSAVSISINIVFGMTAVFQICDILLGWERSKFLVRFLNNWLEIRKDFHRVFRTGGFRPSSPFWAKWGLPLVVAIVVLPGVITIFLVVMKASSLFQACFMSTMIYRLVIVDHMDDAKTLLTFKMVADGFDQIRHGIQHQSRWERITEEKGKKWKKLVQSVRDQNELLASYQKPSELLFISRCILIVTLFAFIVLNIPPHDGFVGFHFVWAAYGALQVTRLYLKTYMADRITFAESKISKELSLIDTQHLDDSCALQLKFIHDVIAQSPCQISLGGYIGFNKGLLLTVFNQVVTYLIVLMQFVQK